MYKQFFFAFFFLTLSLPALAQYDMFNKPRRFSVEVQYASYTDIVENASNPQDELNETINLNANFRFRHLFSIVGMYGSSTQNEWSYYGLGLKVDLPGFFFIGGYTNDLVRQKKLRRVNTSVTYAKMSTTQEGLDKRFIDDKLAFDVDIFVAGDVYLNLSAAVLSHQGNQFFAPAVGLGYEF